MKCTLLCGAVTTLGLCCGSIKASPKLGVGVMLGDPHGLTLQVPLSQGALNASLYYDLSRSRIEAHVDQIFIQTRSLFKSTDLYVGYGAQVRAQSGGRRGDDGDIRGRAPLGVEYTYQFFRGFIEVAPALEVLPALRFHIQLAAGGRLYW